MSNIRPMLMYWHSMYLTCASEAVTDLVICRLSKQSGNVKGGDEVFLLCEKVTKGKFY